MSINFINPSSPSAHPDRIRSRSPRLTNELARPLRGLEWAAALTGDGCVLGAEVTGPLTVGVLRQAGQRLQRRYPLLRARWTFEREALLPTGLRFGQPDPEDLRIEDVRAQCDNGDAESSSLDALVEEHLNRTFDAGSETLCSVVWAPSRTEGGHVLLRISEAVADTHSLVHLYRGLLVECARILQGPTRYDPTTFDTEPVPPSVLERAPFRAQTWLSAGARRLAQLLLPRGAPAAVRIATNHGKQSTNPATRCLGLDGAPSQYVSLMRRLGETNLDLTALVAAAAQRAQLAEFDAEDEQVAKIALEFELRSELKGKPAPSLLGFFSGIATISQPLRRDGTLLEHAKELRAHAARCVRRGTPWSPHFELEQLVSTHGPVIARELAEFEARTVSAALHIGAVTDETLPNRIGPLSLGRARLARRASLRTAPFGLWVLPRTDRLHYCLTCRDEPEAIVQGRALLERIRYWTEQGVDRPWAMVSSSHCGASREW